MATYPTVFALPTQSLRGDGYTRSSNRVPGVGLCRSLALKPYGFAKLAWAWM